MLDFFFDTSTLAKRYIGETGSAWVRNVCAPASSNNIFIAEITAVEITSAIVRRSRGGSLTATDAAAALRQFDADSTNVYFVAEVTSARLTEARRIAETHGLRGYDAVQLAVALRFNREQLAAGLTVVTLVS
ncbi:MAG: type II toxin-antitoxin system VapC family toxin, partial [Acidobacteriota bacterium]|nr:type II toxin-antitoxin system VapC family toxin [Acidobacteriota bacterium]